MISRRHFIAAVLAAWVGNPGGHHHKPSPSPSPSPSPTASGGGWTATYAATY